MSQTTTTERTQDWIPDIERADKGNRLPVAQQFVKDIGITGAEWRVLVDQVFPNAKSVQAIAMALTYCKVRKLDIFKRPVHIVPMWSSTADNGSGGKGAMVETIWPGISELRTTAFRTGAYAGIDAVEYGPEKEITFKAEVEKWIKPDGGGKAVKKLVEVSKTVKYPEWASVVIYRMVHGVRCAFHAKVLWREAYATIGKTDVPNDMWEDRPYGQIDKCVEAAALRKAFPEEIGSDYAAEEMQGRTLLADEVPTYSVPRAETPKPPRPDSAPLKPNGTQAQQPAEQKQPPKPANDQSELAGKQVEDAQVDEQSFTDQEVEHDEVTGEITDEPRTQGTVERDPSDTLTLLEGRLEGAVGALEIEEIYNEMDLQSVFTHLPDADAWISMARKIKERAQKNLKQRGK